MESGSEVARIRKAIELEYQSMMNAKSFACVARHNVIDHHSRILDLRCKGLTVLVGHEQALATIIEVHNEATRCL